MKTFISIIPILLLLWGFNIKTPVMKKDKIYHSSSTNLENIWNKDFNGLWVNESDQRRMIAKCKIIAKNNNYAVQMWGACQSQDCDWGEKITDGVEKGADKFELLWESEIAESRITYEISDDKLKMTHQRKFTNGSKRPDWIIIEYFTKE